MESPPVSTSRGEVADQTSRVPSPTSASTATISSQSMRGARKPGPRPGRWGPLTAGPSSRPGGGRQDRAVLGEGRQAAGRDAARDRGLLRLHDAVLHAVQRLVDAAHGVAVAARAGAALADHHHHDVVVGVGRQPGRRLLAVDLGRAGLGADPHLVEREADQLPAHRAAGADPGQGVVDVVEDALRQIDGAVLARRELPHHLTGRGRRWPGRCAAPTGCRRWPARRTRGRAGAG